MNKLKIGWAKKDISTNEPVELRGQWYMRVSKGVSDHIYSTCLVLDSGDDYVIFTGIDITSLRDEIVDRIRAEVKALCPEIDTLKIIFNATHSHTTPFAGIDPPGTKVSLPKGVSRVASAEEWQVFFVGQTAAAIAEAWQTRSEGKIGYGYGYAVVAHSRRVMYLDDVSTRAGADDKNEFVVNGHVVMYGDTKDDMLAGYEAGADHFLNLMFTFSPEGKLTGAIVNIPCPSQCSEWEWEISADYWADVRAAISEKYGDIFILPQCAAAGDLSPRILHYKEAQDRRFKLKYGENAVTARAERKDIAERVAFGFWEVLDWAKNELFDTVEIKHITKTIELDRRMVSHEEYMKAKNALKAAENASFEGKGLSPEEIMHEEGLLRTKRIRCGKLIARYEDQEVNPTYPMELHVVKIGNIAFASNMFELYMDYMHRIQARSPFEQTFIIQLSPTPNSQGSYLPTQRAVENRGYGADMFGNKISPQGGQKLVEETLSVLNEIY